MSLSQLLSEPDDILVSVAQGRAQSRASAHAQPTPAERPLVLYADLSGDMHDGGFLRFFHNRGADEVAETLSLLERIGARRTTWIVRQAVAVFPNGGVPKEEARRIDLVRYASGSMIDRWTYLEDLFAANASADERTVAMARYIREHQADLLLPAAMDSGSAPSDPDAGAPHGHDASASHGRR
jgi:hypothetical protein